MTSRRMSPIDNTRTWLTSSNTMYNILHIITTYLIILFCNLILFCQTSYESGIKELSAEFRVRLQEELTQREAVEKQLEKQV